MLTARELEDLERGYRERVTDTHLPHIAELPRVLPRPVRRRRRARDRRPASTASSCTSRTRTRWRRSCRRSTRATTATAARASIACGCRSRSSPRCASASPGAALVGCRYLGDDVVEGGNRVDDAAWFGVELARAGLDFLSISKGGKFEDAKQPKVGWAAYPYTGQSGYECMPTIYSDARGPFARNVGLAAHDPRGGARRRARRRRSSPPAASRVRAGRRRARARRRRHRRVGAPDARRSRLVREDARRPRRRDPPLRVHELLRGARPAAQAGHVQAVGSRRRSTRPTSRSPPTASAGSSLRNRDKVAP